MKHDKEPRVNPIGVIMVVLGLAATLAWIGVLAWGLVELPEWI
jgi:hypothetical protein